MILRILWFTCHNPEIDWRIGEVKMMRCLKECGKWQRPKQEKAINLDRYWKESKKEEKRLRKRKENRSQGLR